MPGKTNRIRLTPDNVAAASTDKRDVYMRDSEVPGLAVRISRSGRKAWLYEWQEGGKTRRKIFGTFAKTRTEQKRDPKSLLVTEARKHAASKLAALRSGGPAGATKLRDVWARFLALQEPMLATNTLVSYQSCWRKYLEPELGDRLMTSLVVADVARLRNKIKAPYMSNRVVALLRTLVNFATEQGDMDAPDRNPARSTRWSRPAAKEKPRDRVLSPAELRLYWTGAEPENESVRWGLDAVLYLLLRPSEVCALRWDWIQDDVITFPPGTTKGQRISRSDDAERAVISAVMLDRLNAIRHDGEHVVMGRQGPLRSGFPQTWRRIVKRSGLKDARCYDLKSAGASLLVRDGMPASHIGALARHRPQGITARHYAHVGINEARVAAARLAELLEGIRHGK